MAKRIVRLTTDDISNAIKEYVIKYNLVPFNSGQLYLNIQNGEVLCTIEEKEEKQSTLMDLIFGRRK